MEQLRTETKSISWVVTFPEEKMIVRRPSLKRICQGSADLAELLGYFLYEVSKEAARQGIASQLVYSVTLYRTQEDVLYGIDYSTSRKIMGQNISKLEQLGFLKAFPQQHAYTVFVENIRQALALHSPERKKPHAKLQLPPTEIQIRGQSCRDDMQPYVDRYNKEIKRDSNREYSGEADAIATPPSFFLSVHQSSSPEDEQPAEKSTTRQKENALKVHNKQNRAKDEDGLLEKPGAATPPTVEAFLALADHYRGYRLAHSKKQNSPYRLALEAATTFVNRKKTLTEVDAVFAYMKGIDERFCDDWWPMQTVDLWHVSRHFDSMSKKMAHRRAYSPIEQEIAQASQGFQTYTRTEIMEMPLEERKLYLARFREHMQKQQQIAH